VVLEEAELEEEAVWPVPSGGGGPGGAPVRLLAPVALPPDSSDWRLASRDCTSDTSFELAVSRLVPLVDEAVALEADADGGAACATLEPPRRAARSEEGALEPALCVRDCACISCMSFQREPLSPDTAEVDMRYLCCRDLLDVETITERAAQGEDNKTIFL
jgi:hypothetical protein